MSTIIELVPKDAKLRLHRIKDSDKGKTFIIDPRTGIFAAGQAYLRELSRWRNSNAKTIMATGYIIIEWCNFVRQKKTEWTDADPEVYLEWLSLQRFTKGRISRKNSVIWRWYRYLSRNPLYKDQAEPFFQEISSPTKTEEYGKPRYVAQRQIEDTDTKNKKARQKKIISDESVEALVDGIVSLGSSFKHVRDSLIVDFERLCGLRAGGVSDIKISAVSNGLSHIRAIPPRGNILSYSHCKETQANIRRRLDTISELGGKGVIIRVTEKNTKTRDVMLSVELVHRVLDFIWEFSKNWKRADVGWQRTDPHLFISLKSGAAMLPGSRSDIVKGYFVRFGISGSGHDLRKHRITARALELVRETKKHGGLFDGTAIELILADEFGHKNFSTMKPYVDFARVVEAIGGEAEAVYSS